MSAAEILEELSKLSPAELNLVHDRILELEESYEIDPSPEFSAAIEEGMESLRTERTVSLEEARKKIAVWKSQLNGASGKRPGGDCFLYRAR